MIFRNRKKLGGIVMGLFDIWWEIGSALSDVKDWVEDRALDVEIGIMDIEAKVREVGEGTVEIGKELSKITTGQVFADAATEVLNETIEQLNKINDENKKIVTNTNKRIKETENEYTQNVQKLLRQKELVHRTILCPYIEMMDKLVQNSQYTGVKLENFQEDFDIEELKQECFSTYKKSEVTLWSYFAAPIDTISKLAQSIKMDDEINKAKEENERLKAEKAKVEAKCKAIKKVNEFMDTAYYVVDSLKKQAEGRMLQVKKMLDNKGYNCDDYSEEDIELLKNCMNTVILLNNVVNIQLLNEEGIINPVYKKYIQEQLER